MANNKNIMGMTSNYGIIKKNSKIENANFLKNLNISEKEEIINRIKSQLKEIDNNDKK